MVNIMPKNTNPQKISLTQIRMGTKHEMEHTNSPKVARRIAMDHLQEHPRYYTALNKMEKQLTKKEKGR